MKSDFVAELRAVQPEFNPTDRHGRTGRPEGRSGGKPSVDELPGILAFGGI
jgi:hypothetical protein